MDIDQLYTEIDNFPKNHPEKDLEEYLLALFENILKNKSKPLNGALLIKLLNESFYSSAIDLKKEWLNCNQPPDVIGFSNTATSLQVELAYTIAVLQFQIAELHKMKGKQLKNEYRHMGIESETGNIWYNFSPFNNLKLGIASMDKASFDPMKWSFIGELLERGRLAE